MGRNGVLGGLSGIDAFSKTMDDVRIRTNVGALITLISLTLIAFLTLGELIDYRTVHEQTTLVVDRSRGEKLTIGLNITFPRVPCYLLSVDIMDISGETQFNIMHEVERTRLHNDGTPVFLGTAAGLKGDAERLAAQRGKDYCGSCYGGEPPNGGKCCNTCEEVREAYSAKGWSFNDPDHIDQCVAEHWSEKLLEQNKEGCNVAGKVHVNKVIGNFHISPGKAFQKNSVHVHDLVPYLAGTGAEHHDFGHIIHELHFGTEEEYLHHGTNGIEMGKSIKRLMGVTDPLTGTRAHTEKSQFMFQYFVKVVPSELHLLSGEVLKTHQYSVTSYERDLSDDKKPGGGQAAGSAQQVQHGFSGMPGFFLNFDISGLKNVRSQSRKSLTHFLTSTCAIVGGILTVAGIVDAAVYQSRIRMSSTASAWDAPSSRLGGKLV